MSKTKKTPYLDNERFTKEVTLYASSARDALECGEAPPRINNYIGRSLLAIASNMANRGNFIGYSYRDEMQGDAIEDCIKYLKNFDPSKLPPGKKPSAFSYVSRIIWFAFLRRMGKEEKQHAMKQRLIYSAGIIEEIANFQDHDDGIYENKYLQNLQAMADDYYKMIPDYDGYFPEYQKPSDVRNIPLPDPQ